MLKQLLHQTLLTKQNKKESVSESRTDVSDTDPEIEMILPMLAKNDDEHGDYRFMLKQLKRRNPKAFKKIVSYE
jgi:hypothetical protein